MASREPVWFQGAQTGTKQHICGEGSVDLGVEEKNEAARSVFWTLSWDSLTPEQKDHYRSQQRTVETIWKTEVLDHILFYHTEEGSQEVFCYDKIPSHYLQRAVYVETDWVAYDPDVCTQEGDVSSEGEASSGHFGGSFDYL